MSATGDLAEAIAENITVEVVCVRAPLGAIAARSGVSAIALKNALQRQGGADRVAGTT
jgi:hypothetical protein